MSELESVLVERDGMTAAEARAAVVAARSDFQDICAAGDWDLMDSFMADNFGLEDDYLVELMF